MFKLQHDLTDDYRVLAETSNLFCYAVGASKVRAPTVDQGLLLDEEGPCGKRFEKRPD